MFLLNSRIPLVTVTCTSLHRHGFYRRYSANLPNSLGWIIPNIFAFSARAPVSVLGTNGSHSNLPRFHWLWGLPEAANADRHAFACQFTAAHSRIRLVLIIMILPRLQRLAITTVMVRLPQSVSSRDSASQFRNINRISIPGLLLKGPVRFD